MKTTTTYFSPIPISARWTDLCHRSRDEQSHCDHYGYPGAEGVEYGPGIEEILYTSNAHDNTNWSRGPKANEGGEEIKDGIEAGRKRVLPPPFPQTVRFGRTRKGPKRW